jgi:hypothetical protein
MIFAGDAIIKEAISLGLEDLRKNSWLIDDILSNFTQNPYLKRKYGQKQIDACKEWLLNNKIDVYMRHRDDKDQLPCITIAMGSSQEKEEMKHMGDQAPETVQLLPNQIGKPVPYIVKPFVPTSYDIDTGEIQLDTTISGVDSVSVGMILVNPDSGEGYVIEEITTDGFKIQPGIEITASRLGVVPQYQYYKARVEHSFFQETYHIGCHVSGDPQALLWLWAIVVYCLLRYRESLLEACGFTQSTLNSTDIALNEYFTTSGGEKAWSRYIGLTGLIENTWIKSPQRIIETVTLKEKANNTKGFVGGIKILSNSEPLTLEEESNELWFPIEDNS